MHPIRISAHDFLHRTCHQTLGFRSEHRVTALEYLQLANSIRVEKCDQTCPSAPDKCLGWKSGDPRAQNHVRSSQNLKFVP